MSGNTKGEKISQAHKAYEFIRKAIVNRDLRPGHLLTEVEIADKLEMSRTPVREALNRLKAENLIELVPRRGIYVKSLSDKEICLIYEMAEALEAMVAYLVAQHADINAIKDLEQYVITMENTNEQDNAEKWIAADEHFHITLYSLCGNKYLVEGLNRCLTQCHLARLFFNFTPFDRAKSTKEHRDTFEAIKEGNAERARQLTQSHWKRTRTELLKLLKASIIA